MGNKLPTISYEASDEETRLAMKTVIKSVIMAGWRKNDFFRYAIPGSHPRFISNTLSLHGITYRLIDMDCQELDAFYRDCAMEFVQEEYRRTDIDSFVSIKKFKWWKRKEEITLEIEFVANAYRPYYPLTPLVAKLVAKEALSSGRGECPITFESYSALETLHIGRCGHVFSEAVAGQPQCPLCRIETTWTTVRKSDITT